MSQHGSSRYWRVVALFLSLNAAGWVWIRYAWAPRGDLASHLVMLDVTPEQPPSQAQSPTTDQEHVVPPPPALAENSAPRAPIAVPHVAIVEWLPVSNAANALMPENAPPDPFAAPESQHPFDSAERLIAVFDRAVVGDGELNRPLERPPFQMTPQVGGHWRWTSPSHLAFVLDNPLPPGRKFELTAAVDVDEQIHASLAQPSRKYQFETRSLHLRDVKLVACDRDVVTFVVQFDQPVSADDLDRAMVVSDTAFPARSPEEPDDSRFATRFGQRTAHRNGRGAPVVEPVDAADGFSEPDFVTASRRQSLPDDDDPFGASPAASRGPAFDVTFLTKEPNSRLIVRTRRPTKSLQIQIGRFLKGHSAELPLQNLCTRELVLPAAFAFLRSEVQADPFQDTALVNLYFSRGLFADQEKPKIKVTPAVEDLHVELSPRTFGYSSYHADLIVRGRFLCGQQYSLSLPQTIMAGDGQTLGETSPIRISTPHRPSHLQIAAGQGILIPDGNLALDVQCVNINGVRLSAARLHSNNLIPFLQHGNGYYSDNKATMRSIVHERQRSLDLVKNVPQTVALDLRQLLGTESGRSTPADGTASSQMAPLRGIYRVSIANTDEYWNRDSATVAITDLGITAKRSRDGWMAWVLSLRSAEPQAGVTVIARSYNNQVLAQSTTNADGIATLAIPENHPDGPAWLLTAERDGDLNYLQPDRQSWMIDTVDQSGRAWPDHYEVMMYAERGVYRPGDTVHLTGIVRDRQGNIPPSFPLIVSVIRPDGRTVAQLPCQPQADRQGMFQVDYPSSETGQTGVYRFEVSIPGAKQSLGSTSAQIEAFVPIRIAVDAASLQPRFIRERPTVHVQGRYLFGQPASGLNVNATVTWRRIAFSSKPHSDYQFGDFSGRNQSTPPEANMTLNDQGTVDLALDAPREEKPGLWAASVTTTVTETGGRSVSTTCRVEADTAGIHLGLKPPESKVVAVGEATPVDWVVLDATGAPAAPRPIQMSLVRVDYDISVAQVNGRAVWKTVERLIEIESRMIDGDDLRSQGSISTTCPVAGRYRLRLLDPESKSATQIEFYAATNRSDRVDVALRQPEQLDLVLDQPKYREGDLARVLVRSPFPGRLLLTLEGDRVHDQKVVVMEANSQLIEWKLPTPLRGGAYLSATVIRPIDPQQSDWLPHRAYGLARLVVDAAAHALPLKLEAAGSTLPRSILKVKAQIAGWQNESTEGPADASAATGQGSAAKTRPVVHLWAVDEGILLTTRYATPRPLEFFHNPRKLAVNTSDVYGNLLPDHLRPVGMARIGADAGEKKDADLDGSRRAPVDMPRQNPAVVWRTVQPVAEDGTLAIDMPVPPLTGTLRLMAVAVQEDSYGSTEHPVTVTSPLLVETALPRCAAPGDRFRVPVKLFNTSSAPLAVNVRASVSGPVTVRFAKSADAEPAIAVTVDPGVPLLQWLDVAGKGLGPAMIRIEATATDAEGKSLNAFTESGLAVRTATPLDSETTVTRHQVGEPVTLEGPAGFIPGTTRTSIAVSSLPSAELNPALDALIDYPYGCGEQTSSRLYALIAAHKWLAAGKPAENESGTILAIDRSRRDFVSQLINMGVVRLWSMQRRDGGIGYWSGGHSDPWVSVYAAGAIIAARETGTNVDDSFLADLGRYLESMLDGQSGSDVSDNTRASVCYILALLSKPKHAWMSRLTDRIDFLDAEARAHLALAWIRLGRKDRAAAVLPEDTFRLTATASFSGRITSRVRQDAVLLQALLELDQKHPAIPGLVERLQSARRNHVWANTLENAAAISALAHYRSSVSVANEFTATMKRGDVERSFTHQQPLNERWLNDNGSVTLTSAGKGEFYVVRTTEGLREQHHVEPYDRQLKVRRRWVDRHDREVDPSRLRVGDLVYVQIQISSPDARDVIPNVAIVDALPGGVEIENPRLATSAQPGDQSAGQAEHTEFLDDRAVLVTTVRGYRQVFRYAVRATTAGRFEWPPIQASSMYDPAFASVNGGGKVVIYGRDEEINEVAEKPDENAADRN